MVKISIFRVRKSISVLSLFAGLSLANAQQWENVGSAATISAGGSSYNNIAADASGNLYLSYYDTSVAKGSVQKFDGSSWSYLGGTAGITNGTALYNSLSLDNTGNVYYSNQVGYPNSGMEVRKFTGGAWTQLANVTSSSVNYQATAVSSNNTLFAYSSDGSGTVRRFNNGIWEQVGNAGFPGSTASYPEMIVGSDNFIYVSIVASGLKVFKISANATSSDTWTLVGGQAVASVYSSDFSSPDMAFDSNNVPYVVYSSISGEGRKLNVKKFDGNAWILVGSANFSDAGMNHSTIAVNATGKIYVAASVWDSSNANHSKNSVYTFDAATSSWAKIGGDTISDGAATYNDIIIDPITQYPVLTYSQNGIKVKKFSPTNALSTSDLKSEDFTIFPNPTNGLIQIKGKQKIKLLKISNTVGQLLKSQQNSSSIDLSHLSKGVYFLQVTLDNGKQFTEKIIKK